MDDSKSNNGVIHMPSNRLLFGQFLIEKKKINQAKLDAAIEIQKKEDSATLRDSHRLLGTILLEDFHVFINRIELNHYLQEFGSFREDVEARLYKAKIEGDKKEKHN
jgi:hypothetical protein